MPGRDGPPKWSGDRGRQNGGLGRTRCWECLGGPTPSSRSAVPTRSTSAQHRDKLRSPREPERTAGFVSFIPSLCGEFCVGSVAPAAGEYGPGMADARKGDAMIPKTIAGEYFKSLVRRRAEGGGVRRCNDRRSAEPPSWWYRYAYPRCCRHHVRPPEARWSANCPMPAARVDPGSARWRDERIATRQGRLGMLRRRGAVRPR